MSLLRQHIFETSDCEVCTEGLDEEWTKMEHLGRSTSNPKLIVTALFLLSQAQPQDRHGFVIYWWWRAACDILAGVARHKAEAFQVEWSIASRIRLDRKAGVLKKCESSYEEAVSCGWNLP